jgi:ribosomal protein L28
MTKVCEICGKTNISGRRIQHHSSIGWRFRAPKTKRKFRANLRETKLEKNGEIKRYNVCMKCYKKLRKEERVDSFKLVPANYATA